MGDGGRLFRPIAPRSIPPAGSGGGGERMPGNGASGLPEEGKMKRASTACKECQKRRTRCTGMPCTECVTHGRECVTDELSDKRRKASAKRNQEFLDEILDVLRIEDLAPVEHLSRTVRSGASLDEIHATVQRILHAHAHTLTQSSERTLGPSPQNPHVGIDPNMMDPSMRNYFNPNPR